MSDPPAKSWGVSHSNQNSSSTRVLEQRNLLGGMDLKPVLGRGGRRRARSFHVATEKRVGFAAALALVVAHGREKAKEIGVTSLKQCPRCDHVGPTEQDFGYRIMRGERRPQSWCRGCRGLHLETEASESTQTTSVSHGEEGWLFPPETTTSTRPPRRGKRSST
ncbi:hypothetical protein HUA74_06205 [Myxococcus sp. CA051A]|nr:hypothetical protein [Myxococcus sp. CA040A]NTX40932.1 hypothetical protein [Myxococcus sp. CA033]NTX60246.1 hypothetical protein [Myxococcus sp. CA051A]